MTIRRAIEKLRKEISSDDTLQRGARHGDRLDDKGRRTGDGHKNSIRGYAVAIRDRDEAMAAAREASGERVAEVDGEMTRETFDELHLKPGEVKCVFMSNEGPSRAH